MAELVSAIYMAVFLGAGIWMMMAQVAYVSLYKSIVGDTDVDALQRMRLQDPLNIGSVASGWRRQSTSSWRIVWRHLDDPELEQARRKVVRRWWLTLGVMLVGFPVTLIAAVHG